MQADAQTVVFFLCVCVVWVLVFFLCFILFFVVKESEGFQQVFYSDEIEFRFQILCMIELFLMELKHFGSPAEMSSSSRTASRAGGNDCLQKIKQI